MSFEVVPAKMMSQVRKLLQILTKSDYWPGITQGNFCFNHYGPISVEVKKGAKLLSK